MCHAYSTTCKGPRASSYLVVEPGIDLGPLFHLQVLSSGPPYFGSNSVGDFSGKRKQLEFLFLTRRLQGFVPCHCSTGGPLLYEGISLTMNSKLLNGSQRVVMDGVISDDECQELQRLTNVREAQLLHLLPKGPTSCPSTCLLGVEPWSAPCCLQLTTSYQALATRANFTLSFEPCRQQQLQEMATEVRPPHTPPVKSSMESLSSKPSR